MSHEETQAKIGAITDLKTLEKLKQEQTLLIENLQIDIERLQLRQIEIEKIIDDLKTFFSIDDLTKIY